MIIDIIWEKDHTWYLSFFYSNKFWGLIRTQKCVNSRQTSSVPGVYIRYDKDRGYLYINTMIWYNDKIWCNVIMINQWWLLLPIFHYHHQPHSQSWIYNLFQCFGLAQISNHAHHPPSRHLPPHYHHEIIICAKAWKYGLPKSPIMIIIILLIIFLLLIIMKL